MNDRYDYYDSAVYDLSITGFIDETSGIGWVLFSDTLDRFLGVVSNENYDQQEFSTFDEAFDWVIEQYEKNNGS